MCRIIAALVLMLLLSVPAHSAGAPSLASLNLRVSDLPAPAVLIADNAGPPRVLNDPAFSFDKRLQVGMVAVDIRSFSRPVKQFTVVLGLVALYRTPAAAHLAFLVAGQAERGASPMRIGSVGEEHEAMRGASAGSGVPYGYAAFRRRSYVVFVLMGHPTKALPLAQLIAFARIVDARIQHAH